jgi:hypothetical protein
VHRTGVAEGLAIMSALGMRLEIEQTDYVGGGQHDGLTRLARILDRAGQGFHEGDEVATLLLGQLQRQ